MSKISTYPVATTLTDVKLLGNQAGETKQIPIALIEPIIGIKRYKALLTQIGTYAPTAIILENTIGTVAIAYNSSGSYTISNSLFITGKTFAIINNSYTLVNTALNHQFDYDLVLEVVELSTGDNVDEYLVNTSLLIEVYP